jgi:hypothetical protein
VIAVDLDAGRARLSMAATEHPELWAFLKRYGVFVALDEGPAHPVYPPRPHNHAPPRAFTRMIKVPRSAQPHTSAGSPLEARLGPAGS